MSLSRQYQELKGSSRSLLRLGRPSEDIWLEEQFLSPGESSFTAFRIIQPARCKPRNAELRFKPVFSVERKFFYVVVS